MTAPAVNVGIIALEIYFPNQYVDQNDLEKYDGVSTGKYTIGLGQEKMSFCDDREDIYSISLTTLTSLLRKFAINPSTIGRLEVGTETVLDKSKSCKSVLMQIFEAAGNTDIEGIDNLNACYGGTNALINSVNWIYSPSWDGRNAIVVAGDIALYDQPNARPTGGVGCVAMLIGPQAPLVMDPARGTCIKHSYDFYKPNFKSEYPHVDGQLSIRHYLDALDACYDGYLKKNVKMKSSAHYRNDVSWALEDGANLSNALPLDTFDFMVFHSPTCKLVMKAYARLLYLSYLSNPDDKAFASITTNQRAYLASLSREASLTDKTLEKTFLSLSKSHFQSRVQPSLLLPTMCGNMYCASVWGALISLLCSVDETEDLIGKRVGVYSYGGGLAATFLSFFVSGNVGEIVKKTNLQERLDARAKVSVVDYLKATSLREEAYGQRGYKPQGDIRNLKSGTYYLLEVDDQYRRTYAVKD